VKKIILIAYSNIWFISKVLLENGVYFGLYLEQTDSEIFGFICRGNISIGT
jgi:hypothetical protein